MSIAKNEWAKPGDIGKQCMIPINELIIDHSYQRPEVSVNNTLSIARNFNWEAFNSIVVMERHGGGKYVVDGQQRLLAARKRGDIIDVPCVLFTSDGPSHEAKAFVWLNIKRKSVSAITKFHANVMSGVDPEKQIAHDLSVIGFSVNDHSNDVKGIGFPGHLIETWRPNREHCISAITIQHIIDKSIRLNVYCHGGIYWLLTNGVNVASHVDKIIRMGGRAAIEKSMKMVEIESGIRADRKICGIGILRLINYKLKKRIVINAEW